MSVKGSMTADFYVLTAVHKKYSTTLLSQITHSVISYGVDELLADFSRRLSADDADKIRRELHSDEITDELKKYQLWHKGEVEIYCREFTVSLCTKVESDFKPCKKRAH